MTLARDKVNWLAGAAVGAAAALTLLWCLHG